MKRLLIFFLAFGISFILHAEVYVVAVGISTYKNISSLILPESDAKSIAALYQKKTKNVISITGKYATRGMVIKALNDQFSRAKKGDMVVFFFSGHGYESGFCPYDMGLKKENTLSYEDIYAVFKKSKATHKVILADACMSGGLRQETSDSHVSSRKTSDVVLFLSSRTNEFSIENPKMKNGFFTTFLERGLRGGADKNKDRQITAKEIFTFVSEGVKKISKNHQHPVMWGKFDDNFVMMDWSK